MRIAYIGEYPLPLGIYIKRQFNLEITKFSVTYSKFADADHVAACMVLGL